MRKILIFVLLTNLLSLALSSVCPDDQVWMDCGSPCTKTCREPSPLCAAMCKSRCQCPRDRPIEHEGRCISRQECPMVKQPHDEAMMMAGSMNHMMSKDCPPSYCYEDCEFGYKKDANGCDQQDPCECAIDPVLATKEGRKEEEEACRNVVCDSPTKVCKVYRLTSTGHYVPRCVDLTLPAKCQFPLDMGRCNEPREMWFYDANKLACSPFTYGGCDGNLNRFTTEDECQEQCAAEPPVKCDVLDCGSTACRVGHTIDERGCYTCACGDELGRPVTECPRPQTACMMECGKLGFKRDTAGCPLCECNACPPALPCPAVACPYGWQRDADGCETCVCADDPCENMECPRERSVCVQRRGTDEVYVGECVDPESERLWCPRPPPQCLQEMACEHGFKQDQAGCDKCECQESPPPYPCALEECEPCQYGTSYNEVGCRLCECLPDPCLTHTCADDTVCEHVAVDECPNCPLRPQCIDGLTAKRVSVTMDFTHGLMDDEEFDEQEFMQSFERKASRIMGVDHEYIRHVKVRPLADGVLEVTFHVVTYGAIDIVSAWRTFEEKVSEHEPNTAVEIAGTQFIPKHESLHAEFSSDPTYPEDEDSAGGEDPDDDSATDMTRLIIIISCACGLLVFIIVLAFIIVAIRKTNKRGNHRASYHKAKTSEQPIYKGDKSKVPKQPVPKV